MFSNLQTILSLLLTAPSLLCTAKTSPPSQIILSDTQTPFHKIIHALEKSSIIPDVLDDFTPKCYVLPYYAKKHRSVSLGNELKPSKVQQEPELKIICPELKSTTGLTVVLTDPDAPSRENPEWSQVAHWIAVVPALKSEGDDEKVEIRLKRGGAKDLLEYKPPGPPPKTGFHRYVFVLLQGVNTNLTVPEERKNWGTGKERYGVRDWAAKEGLEVVGANFFVSKNKKQKK